MKPQNNQQMHPLLHNFMQALHTLLSNANEVGKTIGNQPVTNLQGIQQPNLRQVAQKINPQSPVSQALTGNMQQIPKQIGKDLVSSYGPKAPLKGQMAGAMGSVDFSQQPTAMTDNFLADAEHHIKYNVALQAQNQWDKAAEKIVPRPDAQKIAQAIYAADVRDATNPMDMVNMIYRNLPPDLQKDQGVLDALNHYGQQSFDLFMNRIRGSEVAPILGHPIGLTGQ